MDVNRVCQDLRRPETSWKGTPNNLSKKIWGSSEPRCTRSGRKTKSREAFKVAKSEDVPSDWI